jgi:MYXO-CTERM domain-containing protein
VLPAAAGPAGDGDVPLPAWALALLAAALGGAVRRRARATAA